MATRTTYKNRLNKIFRKHTQGFFTDEYWKPIMDTLNELREVGWKYELKSVEYGHENGIPVRKTWMIEIEFGVKKPFYGIIVASGAGSVHNPLERYDVTAYVS